MKFFTVSGATSALSSTTMSPRLVAIRTRGCSVFSLAPSAGCAEADAHASATAAKQRATEYRPCIKLLVLACLLDTHNLHVEEEDGVRRDAGAATLAVRQVWRG